MNLEHDTIVQLITTISIVAALPWVFSTFKLFGRALAYHLHPVTTITLEVEEDDGSIETKTIKIANASELAQNLLKAKRVTSND
ncbi:conserved hypothetical protein [Vibrio chagasii]|uniref:hypothetical protein n=1 Tax=Vibrio TaxID=662 RepID=UPI0015554CB1|nr:hypothetical protein [Vibrio sp. Vb339]CAH7184096.1 conserved hypothetical protein [Vibrio chagasii]CAH7298176.1 conserved hypothetical protein [Vibrio chagasii]